MLYRLILVIIGFAIINVFSVTRLSIQRSVPNKRLIAFVVLLNALYLLFSVFYVTGLVLA